MGGDVKGQTQVDYPEEESDMFVWNHPIDVHYYTKSMQGWPRICLEVWKLDEFGQQSVCGYGVAFFPSQPGVHELKVPVWRPCGTHRDEVFNFYLGTAPSRLVDTKLVHDPLAAKEERYALPARSRRNPRMNATHSTARMWGLAIERNLRTRAPAQVSALHQERGLHPPGAHGGAPQHTAAQGGPIMTSAGRRRVIIK